MGLSIPNATELEKIQEELISLKTHGVAGVKEFTSSQEGPRLLLSVKTHGDEMASLAAVAPFLRGEIELLRGSVVLALCNLPASMKRIKGKRGVRKIEDLDFGRLPKDIFDRSERVNYRRKHPESTKRLYDLTRAGIFDASHGLDMHNVFSKSGPILIPLKTATGALEGLGVEVVIEDLPKVQRDLSDHTAFSIGQFIGGLENNVDVVEIEGGGESEAHVVVNLMTAKFSALANLGMIDPERYGLSQTTMEQKVYSTSGWQMAPAGYRVARKRDTKPFALVRGGSELLRDASGEGRSPIIVPQDSRMLFPIPDQDVLSGADDWFYAQPEVLKRKILAWTLA